MALAAGSHLQGTSADKLCLLRFVSNQEIIDMRAINIITLILVIVGGLNWGLFGLFQFDLVAAIFGGPDAALARIVYVLVGLSAAWQLIPLMRSFSAGEASSQRYQRD
jgi:uncharacterized membrane protein YuzA (DUF378 family)